MTYYCMDLKYNMEDKVLKQETKHNLYLNGKESELVKI